MAIEATATAIINNLLAEYGLSYSAATVHEWVGLLTDDPRNIAIVEEEIFASPQFKERFPGLDARLSNGYNQISVNEYLQLEDSYRSIMRASGLPAHFYDSPGELAEFVANDVSPSEMEARITDGYLAARNAPQEVKDALRQFYGISNSDGALAAYYLDPEKGLEAIQREFQSAVIAGASTQSGFGQISQQQAEELQSLGVTGAQARDGFSNLQQSRQLMSGMAGEVGAQSFSRSQQIDAVFKQDGDTLDAMRRQRERRLAAFSGSDRSAAVTNEGVVGLRASAT